MEKFETRRYIDIDLSCAKERLEDSELDMDEELIEDDLNGGTD
ncbi:MAG: hypothetical protein ABH864_06020 [archaeon]